MSPINFDINPEISVILCTYNRAQYLNNAINSVINQSFTDWELIIVDDGSQDSSFEIVNSYLEKFNNIRYLKHKNKKLGYSKNAGIQASFGKYITFIDSDDVYKTNHLESRIAYMKANPELDLIEGGFVADDNIFFEDYFQPGKIINLRDCILGPTFFGKRYVYFELQGFKNLHFAEDTEFWDRAEKIFKTQKLEEPQTYIYTRAEDSITKTVYKDISPSS
ncbi:MULTISPECIES: glycosyltransferase family 2 protein [Calothrix]|uniref:Glycosyltransferase family 2 protein n=2 Tax=Calothrix TaxID=1186 RepID=A0ABR8A5D8_9CYAN|nr:MULTISPECIES: glycosyltransferase family 2 protein [Calothrix]MBD2195177.1 glycosyltransferase family 2 protein [Calothrix parietina FACHB-288]MBD2223852.1 glycosyltransferase family 2 protein [Calothrix anomala FACHB-343]